MAEKIYTIPVNEAFDADSECPICTMYNSLEQNALDFMMGSAYMEDDIRLATDHMGFCKAHMSMLAKSQNRLGLALILKTHLDRQIQECNELKVPKMEPKSILKKVPDNGYSVWVNEAVNRCYICDRIHTFFGHYIDTVLYLYKRDPAFKEKYNNAKGFCQEHFGKLLLKAQETLNKSELEEFTKVTKDLYLNNLQRLSDDLDWFRYKFDYRYKDEPWKNSKDSIERAIIKTNGVYPTDKK